MNSSNLLRLWRTGANELHYEAKEDDETLDVSEMVVCIFNAYIYIFKDLLQDLKLKEGEFTLSKGHHSVIMDRIQNLVWWKKYLEVTL